MKRKQRVSAKQRETCSPGKSFNALRTTCARSAVCTTENRAADRSVRSSGLETPGPVGGDYRGDKDKIPPGIPVDAQAHSAQ